LISSNAAEPAHARQNEYLSWPQRQLTWRVILVRIRDSIAGNAAPTLWRNEHLDILRGGQAHQRRDKGNPEQLKNSLISVAQSRTQPHLVLLK
jgi:hypothetical protein